MKNSRREFVKMTSAAVAAALLAEKPAVAAEIDRIIAAPPSKLLPKRPLGKTGIELSIIGFGGIVVMNEQQDKADKIVAESVEAGVNYFDVAPSYGNAEEILGPALKPHRDKVFLACKTHHRTAAEAKQTLDESLKKLKTDHFDLFQLHAITDVEKDVKASLAKDGAMQTVLEAKKAGIIRYIGFSAHSPEAAIYAMENFDFDTILYPVNYACHYHGQFEQQVLKMANERGVAILTLKAIARQKWQEQDKEERTKWPKTWYEPIIDPELARKALYWTLSQPGVVATIPPGVDTLFRLAVALAADYRPVTEAETESLEQLAATIDPLFATSKETA